MWWKLLFDKFTTAQNTGEIFLPYSRPTQPWDRADLEFGAHLFNDGVPPGGAKRAKNSEKRTLARTRTAATHDLGNLDTLPHAQVQHDLLGSTRNS